jgi:pSer/pThr/pTyr-binding forkhead associated (FHA) protein
MATNVRVTTELLNPTELGRHYRLLCMTGPNKGKVYYLIGKRIVIGRGESADIQIIDSKISREHAELALADNAFTITDLGAQNGIVVNDSKVKQKKLIDGEKIVIGQTVFKYGVYDIKVSAEMVLAEASPDSHIAKEIKKGVKVKIPPKHIKGNGEIESGYTPIKENQDSSKSKILIFGIIILSVMFILFGGDDNNQKKRSTSSAGGSTNADAEIFNETMNVKKTKIDSDVQKKLDSLIHSGRREFREGNYFRAMEEFRLALLISPNNGQASFYLSKAKQRLDDEIQKNFEKGTQEQDSKKYQAAIVSYCAVAQLIKEYPDDERYKNAMTKISSIESSLGLEKGEIKCFEEKSTEPSN